jgi:hypothetical protein
LAKSIDVGNISTHFSIYVGKIPTQLARKKEESMNRSAPRCGPFDDG